MPIRVTDKDHPLAPRFIMEAVCDKCGHRLVGAVITRVELQREGWRIPWRNGQLLCPECKRANGKGETHEEKR